MYIYIYPQTSLAFRVLVCLGCTMMLRYHAAYCLGKWNDDFDDKPKHSQTLPRENIL